ncbi:heavy-metal-associated domain-containing protein [Isoptericola croceus]|uniref:heavy-metal-associated domain-containing protein n=1 Tax=Isoptericola croceus TaxID=3031406 RepID=UPI0023F6589E|nr:heavy-metal-associated domain-containing protein [Isoptericola croceus]
MRAPARLGLYGLGLVAVFAVTGLTANAIVPDETVRGWAESTDEHTDEHAGHTGHTDDADLLGLGLADHGYRLTAVSAPTTADADGELSLTVAAADSAPVTDFDLEHEKELHLIVVRADGQHFRHVHPRMSADGTWSIPWRWEAAGSYRVLADFVPTETGEGTTLSTSVQVAGAYDPVPSEPAVTATVDGFDLVLEGDLVAGEASGLTVTVARDGQPVTELEPYLGAFGHLVALRDGDLAYLHVHPHGDEPEAGETSGPQIAFEVVAPTEGRYLLYLDFQVDGEVRTAPFVVEAKAATGASDSRPSDEDSPTEDEQEGESHDH